MLLGLKTPKSVGVDNISTYILKLSLPVILPAITQIINLSISKSKFPSAWKHAKVTPLLKKGCEMTKGNFRPVMQVNIVSKVQERIVFKQLTKYLEENNLLHPNQHGGGTDHSTATALAQMNDQLIEEVENDKLVGAMMVDFSSAYDMVPFSILEEKL